MYWIALLGLALLAGTPSFAEESPPAEVADVIFRGGPILTMEGGAPVYAEALAVRDGRILRVGDEAAVRGLAAAGTEVRDLGGAALLPGFVDSHSHFTLTATKLSTVNLDPPPAGDVTSIEGIQQKLRAELARKPRAEGEWLVGWGYDTAMLAERRHPTKSDLDAVSSDVPIALLHFSTHVAAVNSRGLERLGIDASTEDPEGGVIRRVAGSREPDGVLEEQALLPVKSQVLASAKGEALMALLDRAQETYLANGFTTILDMASFPDTLAAMTQYAERGRLKVDLMAAVYSSAQSAAATAAMFSRDYRNHFRVGGGKVNLDGGSPGRTAYLREPYHTQAPGMPDDYRGYSSIVEQDEIDTLVASYYEQRVPIFIHALGDAAIDQAIGAVRFAEKKHPREDVRTQLIHLQVLPTDQIEALRALDVTLTFQNTHNFYFADFHDQVTLGPERTRKLCPLRSALDAGHSVTIHHDSPVHPVDQLFLVWIAASRKGRSGTVYGPEERLTVYEALRASTIDAAYQLHEEEEKGSLAVGKRADLVILDKDPLGVPVDRIPEIRVLETIKDGETVWKRR